MGLMLCSNTVGKNIIDKKSDVTTAYYILMFIKYGDDETPPSLFLIKGRNRLFITT